jgi:phage shock protein PspC (stress-responsive transcriptional regulator)
MNKTITSNISGIIFHIEEDAYEKLQAYLAKVRSRFTVEEGRDEIMSDIESRIAEILASRIGASKQVIIMADVEHVIGLMGEPEAISDNEEKTESAKTEPNAETAGEHRDDRKRHRRLYRDPDDKVVGGVCSGIGYYFDIDPVWIRLGFAIAFFVFGTGLFFYLLLMIILPKAETTSEKLEMRGEPVDINNISRTIKEEFEGIKKRVGNFGEEAKQFRNKWEQEHRDWRNRNRRRSGPGNALNELFRALMRFLAFFMVVFGIIFLVGLLTSTFSLSSLDSGLISKTFSNFFSDGLHRGLGIAGILLVFGIPILMMIYRGIRIIFRITRRDRVVSIGALVLWVTGIIFGGIAIANAAEGFADTAETREKIPLHAPDTIYVRVSIDKNMENEHYRSQWDNKYYYASRWEEVSIEGEELKLGYPQLTVVYSENDSAELVIYKSSRGRDDFEALSNARKVLYPITIRDSVLILPNYFTLLENSFWRGQQVRVELRIPKNTVVFLHGTTRDILSNIENTTYTPSPDMADRRWKMTENGLACIDCAGLDEEENQFPAEAGPKPASDSLSGK